MSDNEEKILHFKSCTGIDDDAVARQHLENAEWDLLRAIQSVTPSETQKLPSEVESKVVPMEEDNSHVTISDDFYSAPSTSNSRIVFNIYNEHDDCSLSITLSDNDTVGHVKASIFKKWGIPVCQQLIVGWSATSDDELLKDLNLKSPVQLSVGAGDTPINHQNAVNGVSNPSVSNATSKYVLHIYDEDHSKEYDLPFPGSKKVLDVKTDMYECSDIPVSQQVWSGWPEGCINDNMTLNQLELNLPVHELSFRSAAVSNHRAERKKRSSRISTPESDSDTSYSSNEDEDMQSVMADDLFDEDFPSKNCICSLVPQEFEDEAMGSIQFAVSFRDTYGIIHPDFFPGTLEQAFKEACNKPAKDRKLLAVYLHHNKSVLTNVFCSQQLCFESVLQYLSDHFIIWGWDVTLEKNKAFLMHTIQTVLGREVAFTVRSTKTEKYPLILIINRVRRNTELLRVIHGDVDVDGLLSALMQTVFMFAEQQVVECREEEERNAREMIKVEQDQAYQQSLEVDRAKLEAKRKQEQLEMEEQAKIEEARQKEAAKKEAHRRVLESKLPPEPEEGTDGITKLRIRVQQDQFLERKFLKTDAVQLLLDFLVVRGYDVAEYKIITSFPRRDLTAVEPNSTFEDLKLYPQETLILQER
ncbi:hypothetical protein V9T40_002684 [Parthenolecanium corni]|uniref:UBX domain-containing protein n=1 Tax=Parthenolecanium corni TaxID=536013 RepID=A0AAN9TIX4_9HEMI